MEAALSGAHCAGSAWRIGPAADAARLDYEYAFDGDVDLLGVTFDVPARAFTGKRWLGRGPYRVYRNRLEGGVLDLHEVAYNDPIPGPVGHLPGVQGVLPRLAVAAAGDGRRHRSTVENGSHVPFFGLFGPRDGEPPMLGFPDTGLALPGRDPGASARSSTRPISWGRSRERPAVSGVKRGSLVLRLASR